jgi:hypothetical protein
LADGEGLRGLPELGDNTVSGEKKGLGAQLSRPTTAQLRLDALVRGLVQGSTSRLALVRRFRHHSPSLAPSGSDSGEGS